MNLHIFCHFYTFDALNLYHCVYYSCISRVLYCFLTNFAPIMSHKISLISCDNRIKNPNIVWTFKKDIAEGCMGSVKGSLVPASWQRRRGRSWTWSWRARCSQSTSWSSLEPCTSFVKVWLHRLETSANIAISKVIAIFPRYFLMHDIGQYLREAIN